MRQTEFDSLTPADWQRMFRMWTHQQLREDLRIARVCYHIVGAFCGYKGISLKAFLPRQPGERVKKKVFKQTAETTLLKQAQHVFEVLKGRVKHG